MIKTFIFLTALIVLSGCGSVVKLIDPTEKYTAYAGAAYDLEMAQQWGLPILDLPLSFLLDSILNNNKPLHMRQALVLCLLVLAQAKLA